MALNYNPLYLSALDAEKVITPLLFKNQTLEGELVNFSNTKAGTVFTETVNNVVIQGYSCTTGATGSIAVKDVAVFPELQTIKMTYCPNDIRLSRFQRDMEAGAWNFLSQEFSDVITFYAKEASSEIERQYWHGISSDTKDAINATASSAETSAGEKALVGNLLTSNYDGVLARLLYSDDTDSFSDRVQVASATVSVSTIATEYGRIYAEIDDVVLSQQETFIYAPRSHRKMINLFNVNATYRDIFLVKDGKYYFNEVEIKFILDDKIIGHNVMIAGPKDFVHFVTDLESDLSKVEIGRLKNDEDEMFLRMLFSAKAHIQKTQYFVLYA